jgi:hypothetical protein
MLQVFVIFFVYCNLQYFGTEGTILNFYFHFTVLCPAYCKAFSYESCSLLVSGIWTLNVIDTMDTLMVRSLLEKIFFGFI